MKSILCYGDSNTWGAIPGTDDRYDFSLRWPGIIQDKFGSSVKVIEEGLRGRTTCMDDPVRPGRNGAALLPAILDTHVPLDIAILMLGTCDLKARFSLSPFCVAQGASRLLEICKACQPPIKHVLLVSPPRNVPTNHPEKGPSFEGGVEKSAKLAQHYAYFAEKFGVSFFDAGSILSYSSIDGIHLDVAGQKKLGVALAEVVGKWVECP